MSAAAGAQPATMDRNGSVSWTGARADRDARLPACAEIRRLINDRRTAGGDGTAVLRAAIKAYQYAALARLAAAQQSSETNYAAFEHAESGNIGERDSRPVNNYRQPASRYYSPVFRDRGEIIYRVE